MNQCVNRRQMLAITGRAVLAGAAAPAILRGADSSPNSHPNGVVIGEPSAAKIGNKILAEGGNAVDAVVAAAFTAAVVSPHNCGIGGYGGHMMIALAGGKKISAIDFNSMAPAAAKPEMFSLDDKKAVRDRANEFGWLASGVPGTLAGLQLAIDRYATMPLRDLAGPAMKFARDGFAVSDAMASASKAMAARLRKDPASANLLLSNNEPYKVGETFRNPDLANLLEALIRKNSARSFYQGAIAGQIAAAFQKNGGLVTAKDLAEYEAREVAPLRLSWRGCDVFTAPLTAGGLTVLESLSILKELKWADLPPTPLRAHALVEALRIAWRDRLALLGDPEKTSVPVTRLLSSAYAADVAKQIRSATREKRPLSVQTESRAHMGTVHLSSVDRQGNMAALTLTHGNSFGAGITVDGLGLILGHGISRFEPTPGHPNSVGPGKRPLHNMCPTVVWRDGQPILALGGAGGRRIVNGVFDALTNYVALGASMEKAIAAPRLHTEGNLDLHLERPWPEEESEYFKTAGYKVLIGPSAKISAVSFDPKTGVCQASSR